MKPSTMKLYYDVAWRFWGVQPGEKDTPWILVHAGAWAFYKAEI